MTAGLSGINAYPIVVEADLTNGLPSFDMVGFLGSEVKEARERVRSALHNTDLSIPPSRLTINLSPANQRKSGSSYDLPIAISILTSSGILTQDQVSPYCFAGELGLDGSMKPIRGAISLAECAIEQSKTGIILPAENAQEAASLEQIPVYAFSSLKEVLKFLKNPHMYKPVKTEKSVSCSADIPDFSDIIGQPSAVRAAEIAAAGMHNLLLYGPPGSGKSMLAKRIPGILPPLSKKEQIEITKIWSVRGTNSPGLLNQRPFRDPHHTISVYAMAGGGLVPMPGEISLAHCGVLFLDELPEYSREALEVMRQPMENGTVSISRTHAVYQFPADFMLVAAMNPCKCGYYPDRKRCRCTERDVIRYQSRISKPLLDRIDLMVRMPQVSYNHFRSEKKGETSEAIRRRVLKAIDFQKRRSVKQNQGEFIFNSRLSGQSLEQAIQLHPKAQNFLDLIFHSKPESLRSYYKLLKAARTIADLSESEEILEDHISEAWLMHNSMNQNGGGCR